MTRPLRIEFDGAIYLVTSSHNAREPILIANTNRILFHDKEEPTSIARIKTPPVALRNYSGFNVCFVYIFISFILPCFVALPFISSSTKHVIADIIILKFLLKSIYSSLLKKMICNSVTLEKGSNKQNELQ